MPSIGFSQDEFLAELDGLSADEVRKRIAAGVYNDKKRAMALLWLDNQERSRAADSQRRSEAFSAEQIRIARSAKNAAWTAATVAMIAMIIASVSAVIAWLSYVYVRRS